MGNQSRRRTGTADTDLGRRKGTRRSGRAEGGRRFRYAFNLRPPPFRTTAQSRWSRVSPRRRAHRPEGTGTVAFERSRFINVRSRRTRRPESFGVEDTPH
ncbi:hypothetical protein SKAU_G00292880 [Synaphobranchus kaupii]|uniref:Uncharacterized protein n=1 Tax=Synaphobranchus kaupii TaxID=118154 RepID=A0A9Q1EU62_SYNKA|nr:hypothetical protein SKAU_G00292880 [Synaphobranchus kaupii]